MQEQNMSRIIWGNAYYSAVHDVWQSRLLCKSMKMKVHINILVLVCVFLFYFILFFYFTDGHCGRSH
jgi:hypothetical protein